MNAGLMESLLVEHAEINDLLNLPFELSRFWWPH